MKSKNKNKKSRNLQSTQPLKRLFVGIDWASKKHDVVVIDGEKLKHRQIDASSVSVDKVIRQLVELAGDRIVTVCIEKARVAVMLQLLEHEAIEVYAVDPKMAARYRESHVSSGAKNDRKDAIYLAKLISERVDSLKPFQRDDQPTRELRGLTVVRRKLVDQRKSFVQQLSAQVKLYHSVVLNLFDRLDTITAMDFLRKYPTPEKANNAHPKEIERFLNEHRIKNPSQVDTFIQKMKNACPITSDNSVIRACSLEVRTLLLFIASANESIAEAGELIRTAMINHPDVNLYQNMPGAGEALTPRLITFYGSDRDRFDNADQAGAANGIAPVLVESGKKSKVIRRRADSKFKMQTLIEFARSTSQHCVWAKAYYQLQRSKAMAHQAAVRKLASRWNRILFRVWKDRIPYDDNAYLANLIKRKHPIINFLKTT